MSVVLILFALTHGILKYTIDIWWRVNAGADSQQQLYRVQNSLERDLQAAAFSLELDRRTIAVEKAPASLANLDGADGDVLWFLSAIDPVSGEFQRRPDGTPFWQRNILYYLATPVELASFGYVAGGLQVGGYESACPFKVLIRKEIDSGPPTSPTSPPETTTEELMSAAEIFDHLNRPTNYGTIGMGGPSTSVNPVAVDLLTFRVDLLPEVRGVQVDVRATGIDRARREGGVGGRDLSRDPATQQLLRTYFPPNRTQPD